MKKMHIAILEYLLRYQSTPNSFFNRYFLLKSRLSTDLKCPEEKIDRAKSQLQSAGLISVSHYQLFVTEKGKELFYEHHQRRLNPFIKIAIFIPFISLFIDIVATFKQWVAK